MVVKYNMMSKSASVSRCLIHREGILQPGYFHHTPDQMQATRNKDLSLT